MNLLTFLSQIIVKVWAWTRWYISSFVYYRRI